jgi:hypothetical protein
MFSFLRYISHSHSIPNLPEHMNYFSIRISPRRIISTISGVSKFACIVTAVTGALFFATESRGAVAAFSTNAPAAGSVIISNLTGAYTSGTANAALNSNVDDPRYVADDQPAQGQTFKTGADTNGYKLLAVSLRQVTYDTFSLVPGINYTIRITRPLTTNTLSVVATETAEVVDDYTDCATCNYPTIASGNSKGAGTGRYITFTFDSPVALAANTTYGFDVAGGDVRHYWETDGRDFTPGGPGGGSATNPYTNGNAYSSGLSNGHGDNTMTNRAGDRVFVVALVPGNVVIPPRITRQPQSATFYSGRTAQFSASAAGGTNLVYQWRKDGANLANGAKYAGALTPTLSISNVAAADVGAYALFVTNNAGSTSSAPATLIGVATPPSAGNSYAFAVSTNNALAYWRLNEAVDPATNPPAYDYIGGRMGTYLSAALKADGPRPASFTGFESGNSAVQITANTDQSWVTVPSLDLITNTVTFTAWIYPNGVQAEFAGLFWSHAGATAAGLAYGSHYSTPSSVGQLSYTWNQGKTWSFVSGLTIPSDQWSFVALVISPANATLYLGSGGPLTNAVNPIANNNELWTGPSLLGLDPLYGLERLFNGVIDEVAIFKRSLSLDEVNTLYNIGRGIVQPVPPAFAGEPSGSQALYAGRTATFTAHATGSSPLSYRWRKNGTNVSDGGNITGSQTDSLTISNVAVADAGAYALVVTNSVGAITSAPPAMLTIIAPSGKAYEAAVRAATPFGYWRLNDTGDPATNAPAFDFWGSRAGKYESAALNGFNGIAGPQPPDFTEFEANNTALEAPAGSPGSWVTIPALNINTNTVTIALWMLREADPVNDYAGLFFSRDASASVNGVGLRYSTNSQLGYVWNLGATETSQWSSGLFPPMGQWSFVALVIDPAKAVLYLYNTNSQTSATNAIPHVAEAWDGIGRIGYDGGFYDGNFPGRIDEVSVFNYALTPSQVLNLYNSAFAVAPPSVTLNIQKVAGNIVLSWPQGSLMEAPDLTGPWTTNNAATSPFTNAPAAIRKFYRVLVR